MPSYVMIKNLALKFDFFFFNFHWLEYFPAMLRLPKYRREVLKLLEAVGDILVLYVLHLLFPTNQIRAYLIQFDFKWLLSV